MLAPSSFGKERFKKQKSVVTPSGDVRDGYLAEKDSGTKGIKTETKICKGTKGKQDGARSVLAIQWLGNVRAPWQKKHH